MLFLANDILQKCKLSSQNPKAFLKQFEEHLREAIKIVVDHKQEHLKDEFNKYSRSGGIGRSTPKTS